MLQFLRTGTIDELANPAAQIPTDVLGEQSKIPVRRVTQEEQDAIDEKARRNATNDLVKSWSDRLQLITVITTFFASTESGLIADATPKPGEGVTRLLIVANAGLVGALVVHVFAAMMSFLAAFLLVTYRVKEAVHEQVSETIIQNEHRTESLDVEQPALSKPSATRGAGLDGQQPARSSGKCMPQPQVWSANPHLEQVGPFLRQPPMHLLRRCHILCIVLTMLGFLLALLGTLCLAWHRQPLSVGVFATCCVGLSVVCGTVILM